MTMPPADLPLLVALLLGAAGVYLGLPRARPYPRGAAAACVALALALAAWLGWTRLGAEPLLFYAFSGLAVVGGLVMITQTNPARAALSFALVVLSTCGLFLLNAAPFLMAGTVIVYAGAIVVTFLFVLMLAQPGSGDSADQRSREPFLATLAGLFLLAVLLLVLRQTYGLRDYDALLGRVEQARRQETAEAALAQLGDDFAFRQQAEALFQRTFGTSATANKLSLILSQFDNIPTRPQPDLP